MTERPRPFEFTIGGAGGGGKDGGGGGVEAPNSLRSKQVAKVVDLISEGPIKGIVGGLKGIFLDGVAMQNANGTMNFTGASVQLVRGLPAQPIMNGFASQQSEEAVSVQLKKNFPIVRAILNTDADRARITVSVPSLQHINKDSGDINGTSVQFRIECQNDGGGYKLIGNFTISGKTTSNYQRSIMFMLPAGGPWDLRVSRLTADSTVAELQNDLYWDSYTEIIDDRLNYTNSACCGVLIDAEQFRSIPKRAYLVDGLIIKVPINYYDNYSSVVYQGVWTGAFKPAWTRNPAWVLYDLITNNRYGIGQFMQTAPNQWAADKWSFYKVAQWCDARVDNGKGSTERRWTCDVQISNQQEAFDLLQQVASIFRGFTYWSGGQLVAVADQPGDPVQQFANANVIEGQFSYAGADIRARHTMATISWNDPEQLGETRQSIVEDQDAISRFGIQSVQVPAFGCISESQAIRTGKWVLFTEQYEAETTTFQAGLGGAFARPGDIFRVADITISGRRYGGRVAEAGLSHITFDKPIPSLSTTSLYVNCIVGDDAHIETRGAIADSLTDATRVVVSPQFSEIPNVDTTYVLNDPGLLEPTLWRLLGGKQQGDDRYEMVGLRHLPSKWDYIEKNKALTIPDVTDIVARPAAIQQLTYVEYLVQTSPISVGVRVTLSWISPAPLFDVLWRRADGNWDRTRTDAQAADLPVTEGPWEFQVTPIGTLGNKGPTTNLNATIIGRLAPPQPPKQFRVNVVDGVAMFDWLPATEIDVIIGGRFELRHTSRTSGSTWNTAQIVIPAIPGRATSVEAGYQPGTWMLRTFDILDTPSATWATIIAAQPDGRYTQWVRICENPDFLGVRHNTEVLEPQNWLIIGATGGLWDEQLDDIDTWPTVDVLPESGAPTGSAGTYEFSNRIDAGGLFTVRFSSDILAFPYATPDAFFDSRLTDSDTWSNWDDTTADLDGQVTVMIRETLDDPASPTATWGAWHRFTAGEYYARAWEFRADLAASPGQNIGVETLCIGADLRNKIDAGEDVPYPAAQVHVDFNIKFFTVPAVVITVQDANNLDDVLVINKTRTGFDLTIKQGAAHQVRTFDWHAQGY